MKSPSGIDELWHALSSEQLEAKLITGSGGLKTEEAKDRLARHGPNKIEDSTPPSVLLVLLSQLRSPLIYILLAAALVTVVTEEYIDTGVILAAVALNTIIGFLQERKAEFSVRALQRLAPQSAQVEREGTAVEIPAEQLVPGDLVHLASGVRVPADIRLITAEALDADESLLTGESTSTRKSTEPLTSEYLVVSDTTNTAYAGTIIVHGRGTGYVVATGLQTELGRIAEHVRLAPGKKTPLQHRMDRLARIIGIVVAVSSGVAFVGGVLMGESSAAMFLVAVALAVAAIPEGLPVATTITMALGVRRMAQRNAIVRRLSAVETLGSTTVIATDKTGTLTQNRMAVQEVWTAGTSYVLGSGKDSMSAMTSASEPLAALLTGALTNEAQIAGDSDTFVAHGDGTEVALLVAAEQAGIGVASERIAHYQIADLPFESERQFSATWRMHGDEIHCHVKGAPEKVLTMCTDALSPSGVDTLQLSVVKRQISEMAGRGLRVIALALGEKRPNPGHGTPEQPERLTFLGLVGLIDPPREGVREAIEKCHESGIRVLMITGDHADTAKSIAASLGIASHVSTVLSGGDIRLVDDEELRARVAEVSVFARVSPEQKLRIVNALQGRHEVVAVTGDGVNDAPALKAADIGVAMGRDGTDVARDAADIVLSDDNFASIHAAVEEGRTTFGNLRKVAFFLVSSNASEVLAILVALAFGWPLLMLPAQLLWLNLVSEGIQDIGLAFEPGEPGALRKPPRKRTEGIISPILWERTIIAGLVMAAGTLLLFWYEMNSSGSLVHARSVALTTMVVFQVFHVGNSRSERDSLFARNPFLNPLLFVGTFIALVVHTSALYIPFTQWVLRVEPIDLADWGRIVVVAATILVAMELHKLVRAGAHVGRKR